MLSVAVEDNNESVGEVDEMIPSGGSLQQERHPLGRESVVCSTVQLEQQLTV